MNIRSLHNFILILLCLVLPQCGSQQTKPLDLAQVRKTIESQNAKWAEASKKNDISTLVSIYTEDATVLPPNRPMLRGIGEIRAMYERIAARHTTTVKALFNTIDVSGKDSTVFEIGEYFTTWQPENGPVKSDTGKYTTIWKLQSDGTWKIHADCWNSNKPLKILQQEKQ